jgi:hypothetical protein
MGRDSALDNGVSDSYLQNDQWNVERIRCTALGNASRFDYFDPFGDLAEMGTAVAFHRESSQVGIALQRTSIYNFRATLSDPQASYLNPIGPLGTSTPRPSSVMTTMNVPCKRTGQFLESATVDPEFCSLHSLLRSASKDVLTRLGVRREAHVYDCSAVGEPMHKVGDNQRT